MAGFNGSGTYTRPYNWANDKANGIDITASRFDTDGNDVATALSTCICKDGQQTTTARIPFAVGLDFNVGSVSTPGLSVIGDTGTGLYQTTVGEIRFGSEGVYAATLNANGLDNTRVGAGTAASGAFTTLAASSTVSGTGFSTYLASPPAIGGSAAAAGSFTTLSASSTVSGTGFSTYLASPPAIGGSSAAAGSFTTLSASSTVSGTGFSTYLASPPAIGGTSPAAGKFTGVTATGSVITPFVIGGSATNATLSLQSTSGVGSGSQVNILVGTNGGTQAASFQDTGSVFFSNVGTTASAANAFLNSGASNQLLRSTSSLRYKTDIQTLEISYAKTFLEKARPVWYRSLAVADNPKWGHWGFIAEELAEIDPRLVTWTHDPVLAKDLSGKADAASLEALKDIPLVPDGAQYERVCVILTSIMQDQQKRIEALEAKLTK